MFEWRGYKLISKKDILIYVIGLLVGISGLWFALSNMEQISNAILNSDIRGLKDLSWYELIIGFGIVLLFIYLIVRSLLLPLLYFIGLLINVVRSKR